MNPARGFVTATAILVLLRGADAQDACIKDVDLALAEIEKRCGRFFDQKRIDWKQVSAEMRAAARKVEDEREHLGVLIRLLARLKDGHAEVRPLARGKTIKPPDAMFPPRASAGFRLCRAGTKLYVKSAFGGAASAGLAPGLEISKIGRLSASDWVDRRRVEMADVESFSTEQQATYAACNFGSWLKRGERIEIECVDQKGSKLTRTLTCGEERAPPPGPAFLPENLAGTDPVVWGRTKAGFGYAWIRKCVDDLPRRIDPALGDLAGTAGIVLDFRGCVGGAFDHDEFFGRFVPKGKTLSFGKRYQSTGEKPYAGPITVIVDAGVRSAGETASGMLKEDGRAYMIGESATAGMSSQKELIELPSKLFALYVSVGSNKGRFNGGKGIEGIGVEPHEIVSYDPNDLRAGVDTLLRVAEERLASFPHERVPYRAEQPGSGR